MSSNTDNLKLIKSNPVEDGNDVFNIDTFLNANWDKVDKFAGEATAQLSENTQNIANKIDKSKVVTNLAVTETGFLLDALTIANKFASVDSNYYKTSITSGNINLNSISKDGIYLINTIGTVTNAPSEPLGILIQNTIVSGVMYQIFLSSSGKLYKRTYWYNTWNTWN